MILKITNKNRKVNTYLMKTQKFLIPLHTYLVITWAMSALRAFAKKAIYNPVCD